MNKKVLVFSGAAGAAINSAVTFNEMKETKPKSVKIDTVFLPLV